MADNLTTQSATPATIPASTTIATDDAGAAGHVQVVKLAVSTDGSATPLTANNTDGLLVNLGSNNDVTVSGTVAVTDNSGTLSIDDGGGTITVDGTVSVTGVATAANQSTGNTALAAIQTAVETLDNAISGSEMQVDVLTMPTVTVNSHAVTNAGTFAVQVDGNALTSLQLLDDTVATDGSATPSKGILIAGQDGTNAQTVKTDSDGNLQVDVLSVSGTVTVDGSGSTQPVSHAALTELAAAIDTEVQVDIVGALPAGANNIGDVDVLSLPALPAGTNNIGDVDVLSVVPGTGATNLGKAEDAAHTTGDVGVMALAVRQSSQADFGADGDYVPFSVDDDGGLRVSIVAGAGSGGTAQADDADFTDGTTQGTPAMGVYEATPSTVTDGDLGIVGITEDRALRTSAIVTSSALPSGAATSAKQDTMIGHLDGVEGLLTTIDADTGTVAGAVSGSEMQVDVVAALPAGTNNIGDVDIASIAAGDNNIGNVDIASIAAGDNNIGNVDIVTMPNVTLAAGTNAIGKLAANSGVDIGDVDVTSLPALAAGTNAIGKLLPPDIDVTAHTNYIKKYYTSTGAATDGIIWSPAAGKRWHVVSMYINVSAAATVTLEDDKSGGDEAIWKGEYAANSGVTIHFGEMYALASGEDAADLIITTSAGNVYVTVTGFEI